MVASCGALETDCADKIPLLGVGCLRECMVEGFDVVVLEGMGVVVVLEEVVALGCA